MAELNVSALWFADRNHARTLISISLLRFGHYDTWCYLPAVGFIRSNDEAEQYLFTAVLRPGNAPPGTEPDFATHGAHGAPGQAPAGRRPSVVGLRPEREGAPRARRGGEFYSGAAGESSPGFDEQGG